MQSSGFIAQPKRIGGAYPTPWRSRRSGCDDDGGCKRMLRHLITRRVSVVGRNPRDGDSLPDCGFAGRHLRRYPRCGPAGVDDRKRGRFRSAGPDPHRDRSDQGAGTIALAYISPAGLRDPRAVDLLDRPRHVGPNWHDRLRQRAGRRSPLFRVNATGLASSRLRRRRGARSRSLRFAGWSRDPVSALS